MGKTFQTKIKKKKEEEKEKKKKVETSDKSGRKW